MENLEKEVKENASEIQEEVQKEEVKEETVPLATFLSTKSELKALKKRLAEAESSKYDTDIENQKTTMEKALADNGVDENVRSIITEQFANIRKELKTYKVPQDDYDDEIEDLAKDRLTSDAKTYKDAIKAKIAESKAKGIDLDAETAYFMVRNPRLRMKELIEEEEQKQAVKRSQVDSKPAAPESAPSNPKNPYPLDEDDKKALEGLKKYQPDKGWNEEKYYKSRYGK